jgi:hypothetical protein
MLVGWNVGSVGILFGRVAMAFMILKKEGVEKGKAIAIKNKFDAES